MAFRATRARIPKPVFGGVDTGLGLWLTRTRARTNTNLYDTKASAAGWVFGLTRDPHPHLLVAIGGGKDFGVSLRESHADEERVIYPVAEVQLHLIAPGPGLGDGPDVEKRVLSDRRDACSAAQAARGSGGGQRAHGAAVRGHLAHEFQKVEAKHPEEPRGVARDEDASARAGHGCARARGRRQRRRVRVVARRRAAPSAASSSAPLAGGRPRKARHDDAPRPGTRPGARGLPDRHLAVVVRAREQAPPGAELLVLPREAGDGGVVAAREHVLHFVHGRGAALAQVQQKHVPRRTAHRHTLPAGIERGEAAEEGRPPAVHLGVLVAEEGVQRHKRDDARLSAGAQLIYLGPARREDDGSRRPA
mmetsp:Transcript_59487/g.134667  ORF Transcript_59487/g.134667 Transcript_59487/m.134667 type:complete len:363 (+) Transcript_59487:33-1121(+)